MEDFHTALALGWRRLRQSRITFFLWLAIILIAVLRTIALTAFMVDPKHSELSTLPHLEDMVKHSCLTAYVYGSNLAHDPPDDMYAVANYSTDAEVPGLDVSPFNPEPFQYPPQFLLPVDLLLTLTTNFQAARLTWYFGILLLSVLGLYLISRWIGGEPGAQLLLWIPVLWATPFFVTALQIGNIHFVIVVITFLAMIAFDRGHRATGGLLLAYAISSKIFPGIFGIYLLVQRRFKDALWTAGFGAALAALSALVHGPEAMHQFLTIQVPRLADGSAFEFFQREEWYPLASLAFRSILVKMEAVGLIESSTTMSGAVGLAYTLLILPICIVLAKWTPTTGSAPTLRMERFLVWSVVLALASFQGPFTPMPYAPLGPIWLLVAVAVSFKNKRHIALLIPVWIFLALPVPDFVFSLLAHVALYIFLFAVAIWHLRIGHLRSLEASPIEDTEPLL
jgi:hypothetical protein